MSDDESKETTPTDDSETSKPAKKKKKKPSAPEPQAATARGEERESRHAPEAPSGMSPVLVGVLALAIGGGVGWFVRGTQGAQAPAEAETPAAVGSASADAAPGKACQDWKKAICDGAGAESEGCLQAEASLNVLSEAACTAAQADVAGSIARLKSARGACDTLVGKLCEALGKESETCKMVTAKTPTFPTKQCDEMLKNYDAVLAELTAMERKNAPLTADVAAKQRAGDVPGFGPVDAKLAVVEYSDFECPYCSKAADAINVLKKRYGKQVRFVFRQYPLSFHKNAQGAAEASLAANAQGKFWEMHDIIFANQRTLDRASLDKFAKEIGLDMAKYKKAMDDGTYSQQVKDDMKLGEEIGVSGTPTMVVGTKRVTNPSDPGAISAMIDAELIALGETPPAAQ